MLHRLGQRVARGGLAFLAVLARWRRAGRLDGSGGAVLAHALLLDLVPPAGEFEQREEQHAEGQVHAQRLHIAHAAAADVFVGQFARLENQRLSEPHSLPSSAT
jgi:hypothetical protein